MGHDDASGRDIAWHDARSLLSLTVTGKLDISVPRDRLATFDPELIAKYRRRAAGFDEKIVSMYARGMTVRERSA